MTMISSANLNTMIISVMISIAFILIFLLTILRCHYLKEIRYFKKNYMALVIDSNQTIEMTVPVHEQQQSLLKEYFVPIQTETLHTANELKPDFYQSIFFYNESPYVSVRETVFVKKDDEFNDKSISNI